MQSPQSPGGVGGNGAPAPAPVPLAINVVAHQGMVLVTLNPSGAFGVQFGIDPNSAGALRNALAEAERAARSQIILPGGAPPPMTGPGPAKG